jgi:hypothetical protein
MINTLDLSSVTDRLVDQLTQAIANWPGWNTFPGGTVVPFTITPSGKMPETIRNSGGCELTMYLFHVVAEPATRNSPLVGPVAQPNQRQAMGLTLYYLLTAFARDNVVAEQQAMSIALRAFHGRGTYVDPVDGFTFTITLESERSDEANRRWQSFSTPFRLSAVYRVSVVFLTPLAVPPVPAGPPQRIGLALAPVALPFAGAGALTSTASRADFAPLTSPGDQIVYDYSPAVAAPGSSFAVFGAGLDQPTARRLYLVTPAGAEIDVTSWRSGTAALHTASRIVLTLPATVGTAPTHSPVPGVYQLRAGSDTASGDARTYRSNSVPVLLSAHVVPPPSPWNPIGGVHSFTGAGFVPAATELLLDTIVLKRVTAAPAAGEFQISGNTIELQVPAGLPAGTYFVRLRVSGVEGPPVGRIVQP